MRETARLLLPGGRLVVVDEVHAPRGWRRAAQLLWRIPQAVAAWLLVAPSGGINVWCASSGGHLSTHQVVTVLKASGIADKVNHRTVILPQLAATGVVGLDVFRRSRWKVHFGPVDMRDLPE